MMLVTDQGIKKENPSWDEISNSIDELVMIDGSFIILSQGKNNFVQATMSADDGGIMLEYREELSGPLCTSYKKNLTTDDVSDIFKRYYLGEANWKTHIKWHCTEANNVPQWARITAKLGKGGLALSFIAFFLQYIDMKDSDQDLRWIIVIMVSVVYSMTAANIEDLYAPKKKYSNPHFWPFFIMSIVITIVAIFIWQK